MQTALVYGGDLRAAGGGLRSSVVDTLLDRSGEALLVAGLVLMAVSAVDRVRTRRSLLRPVWREPRTRVQRATRTALVAGTVLTCAWLVVYAHTTALPEPGTDSPYRPQTFLPGMLLAGGLVGWLTAAAGGVVSALRGSPRDQPGRASVPHLGP
ncbi:hypothetical protein [Cellulomonas sp. NS3]|uniref:hypothetical protein n=1 Tax=Cellulomonas sp. NS3 TaxID=2973977 RepID=UPI002162F517|nr:hypothetical protein [Cellulomonas sp. NS3]